MENANVEYVSLKKVYREKENSLFYVTYAMMKPEGNNRQSMTWHAQNKDGDEDEFMFLDLLTCPEIGVVYVLDYYGFRKNTWMDAADEIYHTYLPKTQYCLENFMSIKKVLLHLTGLRMVHYNKGHFKASRAIMGNLLLSRAGLFYHKITKNCWIKIAQNMAPDWMALALNKRAWRGKLAFFQNSIDGLIQDYTYYHLFDRVYDWVGRQHSKSKDILVGEIYTRDMWMF